MTTRAATLALISSLALSQAACGLVESDFEGKVRLTFQVDDEDKVYKSVDMFDPNDNEDYRNNKDRIRAGRIDFMELEFVGIGQANQAQLVVGEVDVRDAGDETNPWKEGITAWEGIQVVQGNKFLIDLPADQQADVTKLVFEREGESPLELRIDGEADQGPVDFQIQVTLNMTFTAGL